MCVWMLSTGLEMNVISWLPFGCGGLGMGSGEGNGHCSNEIHEWMLGIPEVSPWQLISWIIRIGHSLWCVLLKSCEGFWSFQRLILTQNK